MIGAREPFRGQHVGSESQRLEVEDREVIARLLEPLVGDAAWME